MSKGSVRHEIRHSLAIIKRLTEATSPVFSKMSAYCLNNRLTEIASPNQLELARETMEIIEKEVNKLLEICDHVIFIEKQKE